VRFDEVQARTRELAQWVEELQALREVSQAYTHGMPSNIAVTFIMRPTTRAVRRIA
jgi:hypothetical protein